MSLFSGLFTLPIGFGQQAYKQTCLELPWARSSVSGSHIQSSMEPLLEKAGIREDLIVVEALNMGFCSAMGTNTFRNGGAAIILAPGFYELDEEACSWIMKHEISHIKNNDLFTMFCVPAVCQLAASIYGMRSLSFWPALGLAFTVGAVSQVLFSQWREAKADDFAIENSCDEELKGGRRFLMALQETGIEERTTFWKRVTISASGDMRSDLLHPSLSSRIQKIERALRDRNADIDIEAEREKLDGELKIYVREDKRKVERAVEQRGGTFGIMKQMWF